MNYELLRRRRQEAQRLRLEQAKQAATELSHYHCPDFPVMPYKVSHVFAIVQRKLPTDILSICLPVIVVHIVGKYIKESVYITGGKEASLQEFCIGLGS